MVISTILSLAINQVYWVPLELTNWNVKMIETKKKRGCVFIILHILMYHRFTKLEKSKNFQLQGNTDWYKSYDRFWIMKQTILWLCMSRPWKKWTWKKKEKKEGRNWKWGRESLTSVWKPFKIYFCFYRMNGRWIRKYTETTNMEVKMIHIHVCVCVCLILSVYLFIYCCHSI